ncbi:hypothetical protein KFE25_013315 [Diacronema lutheri]|uniref:RRM domain-containing protein n=1 Tax=Diacronema lutheri TaxID=2081491 RepID=A0A8J6CB12_DIALT|nr:hypothetical protein KFE25_013315 [Diacronema lutheri]
MEVKRPDADDGASTGAPWKRRTMLDPRIKTDGSDQCVDGAHAAHDAQEALAVEAELEAQLMRLMLRAATSVGEPRSSLAACKLLVCRDQRRGGACAPCAAPAERERFAADTASCSTHFARLVDSELRAASSPRAAATGDNFAVCASSAPPPPARAASVATADGAADAQRATPSPTPRDAPAWPGVEGSDVQALVSEAARAANDAKKLDALCTKLYAELQQLHTHMHVRARAQLIDPTSTASFRRVFFAGLPLDLPNGALAQAVSAYGRIESCEAFHSPSARGTDGGRLSLRIATALLESPLAAAAVLADVASGRLALGGARAPELAATLDEEAGTFTTEALNAAARASSALQAATNARARCFSLSAAARALAARRAAGADASADERAVAANVHGRTNGHAGGRSSSAPHGGAAVASSGDQDGGRAAPHGAEEARVFVTGLLDETTSAELTAALAPCGLVLSAQILTHPANGQSLRVGSARMADASAAAVAVRLSAAGLLKVARHASAYSGSVPLSVTLDAKGAKAEAAYAAHEEEHASSGRVGHAVGGACAQAARALGEGGAGARSCCGARPVPGAHSHEDSHSRSRSHGQPCVRCNGHDHHFAQPTRVSQPTPSASGYAQSGHPPPAHPPSPQPPPSHLPPSRPTPAHAPLARAPPATGRDAPSGALPPGAPSGGSSQHAAPHSRPAPSPGSFFSRAELIAHVMQMANSGGALEREWRALVRMRCGEGADVEPSRHPTMMLTEYVRLGPPTPRDGARDAPPACRWGWERPAERRDGAHGGAERRFAPGQRSRYAQPPRR